MWKRKSGRKQERFWLKLLKKFLKELAFKVVILSFFNMEVLASKDAKSQLLLVLRKGDFLLRKTTTILGLESVC